MISETAIFGILVALLMLGPLVVLHEFGHYFAAKMAGVKALEFGFGFPPRIFGIWTGSTAYLLTPDTQFRCSDADEALAPGEFVTLRYIEAEDGSRRALTVRPTDKSSVPKSDDGMSAVTGKIRELRPDHIVLRDMLWSINWLPLGGFVRLMGEEDSGSRDSLASKSVWARLGVMLAGVGVNALLPFVIFIFAVMIPVEQNVGDVVIASVFPDSPAYNAGIRPHHKILEVDGTPINSYGDLQLAVTRKLGAESEWTVQRGIPNPFARPTEPQAQYMEGESEQVTLIPRWHPPRRDVVLEVEDEETQIRLAVARVYNSAVGINDALTVVPDRSVEDTLREVEISQARQYVPGAALGDEISIVNPSQTNGIPYDAARGWNANLGAVTYLQEGAAGVQMRMENERTESFSEPLIQAIPAGIERTFQILHLAWNSVVGVVNRSPNPQFEGPIAVGPVGLTQLSGEVATADIALLGRVTVIMTLAATLSISLAVINLLPIPGLDGGRMLFVLIEMARGGKRISPEKENMVHFAGFALLIGALILISFGDLVRIFNGQSFF